MGRSQARKLTRRVAPIAALGVGLVWLGLGTGSISIPGGAYGNATMGSGAGPAPFGFVSEPTPMGSADSRPLWKGRGWRRVKVREGEGVAIFAKPNGRRLGGLTDTTDFDSRRVFSVISRQGNWLEVTVPVFDDNRPVWIRIDRKLMSFSTTRVSLHVDLTTQTLEYRHRERVVASIPITIGAPGTETPSGRFAITDVLTEGLDPVYGCCALAVSAVQDDLPESWPGGDRIGIHGTSGSVGGAASLGCMRVGVEDLGWLAEHTPLGAPVFVE